MSFIDGTIGKRRNDLLQVRLTSEEKKTLENMASSYNMEKSELVRHKLFDRTIDYVKSEINNAIEKVKDGYQKATKKAKQYFTDPEDIYLPAYAPAGYGIGSAGYK